MSVISFEARKTWAALPALSEASENDRTHGITTTLDGRVIVFSQRQNGIVHFAADGGPLASYGGDQWLGAHGLTKVIEDGEEFLWLTDELSCEVAKTTLEGEVVMRLAQPEHPAYAARKEDGSIPKNARFIPTWASVHPLTKDIWVADGYGASLVHRYSPEGIYLDTIDGTEGAGRFNCPHGIAWNQFADGSVSLFIADRANHRVAVYDQNGAFVRASSICHSPCSFAFNGNEVLVPELFTGVKILDAISLELLRSRHQ